MPIIRKFAIQGPGYPKMAYSPHGPFSPEVLNQNSVVYDNDHGDSLHAGLDDVRMFRCKECGTILYEDELSSHECEEYH